jgi:hypothetical protein
MRLRRVALVLQVAAVGALGAGVAASAGQLVRNHRGWALDALGWVAVLLVVQVALLAWAWRVLGGAWWPADDGRLWLRSFVRGWVARYVPGPPTGPAGKLLALREAGLGGPAVAALLWVDQVLGLAAGLAAAAALAVPAFGPAWALPAVLTGSGALVLAVAGTRPALVRRVSGKFGREGMRGATAVEPWRVVAAFAAMTAAGLVSGLAFHVTAVVVSPWPLGRWEEGAATFCLASLVGYVAPFAPSGAGVRESVIVTLLGRELGVAGALAVAVVARATSVLVDAVLIAGFYGASAIWRRSVGRRAGAVLSKRRA